MGTMTVDSSMVEAMPVTAIATVENVEVLPPSDAAKNVTRLRDLKTSARDQFMIDPRIITVADGHNPRNYDLPENRAHLDELKRSIRECGVLIPLLVRFDPVGKSAVVVDGECRLRATLELIAEGIEILTVPTIGVTGGNEQDWLLKAITANTGKPLSKWELGGAFQRLYNYGWDEPRIAVKTGYTERFVREAMELADAPEEIKHLLSSQAVTPSLALSELRTNGAAAVENLKAAATAAQASGKKGPAKRAKAPVKASQSSPSPSQASGKTSSYVLPQSAVVKAILSLLEDVPAEDLNCTDKDAQAVVKVSKLLKLASFAVTDADLKAAGAK